MTTKNLSSFIEFCRAYVNKLHFYTWVINLLTFLIGLTTYAPFIVIALLILTMFIWLFKGINFGWSNQKINNLLRYKELIGEKTFTPLEQEILDRYFGKHQRKQLIIEEEKKTRWKRYVNVITVCSVVLAVIGVYLFFLGGANLARELTPTNSTDTLEFFWR